MYVIALLLYGRRAEPYLRATLDSLHAAVDRLVVNDNGGDSASINRRELEASRMFAEGRVDLIEAPFEGFGPARNLCLRHIAERIAPTVDGPLWVLMVDADEVHGRNLARVTRQVLPAVPADTGVVDGYVVQFMESFDYFISVDRRHNLLYRFNPELRYVRDVHEQLQGIRGRRLCLPYLYCHYGYVRPHAQVLEKWLQYHHLGDSTYEAHNFPNEPDPAMFFDQLPLCMPYPWHHPPALHLLPSLSSVPDENDFRRHAADYLAKPWPRIKASARVLNYRLRLVWRVIVTGLTIPRPRVWLQLARMAVGV